MSACRSALSPTDFVQILIYGPPSTPPGIGGHTAGTASPQRGHTKREIVPRRRSSDESSDLDAASEDDHDDATSVDSPTSAGKAEDHDDSSRSEASAATPTDQRTVMIRNLPDRVTYRDVVDAVKSGGALVHVYLRARERIASVSFVEEAAARSFLQHSNTHGLLVAGKRVSASLLVGDTPRLRLIYLARSKRYGTTGSSTSLPMSETRSTMEPRET